MKQKFLRALNDMLYERDALITYYALYLFISFWSLRRKLTSICSVLQVEIVFTCFLLFDSHKTTLFQLRVNSIREVKLLSLLVIHDGRIGTQVLLTPSPHFPCVLSSFILKNLQPFKVRRRR